MKIHRLIKYSVESQASDLHRNADSYYIIRLEGTLKTIVKEEPMAATALSW